MGMVVEVARFVGQAHHTAGLAFDDQRREHHVVQAHVAGGHELDPLAV